jgi:hypothetical protein
MTDVERRPRLAPQTPRVGPASREVEVPRSFSPKRTTMHWVHRVTSRACFHAPAPAFPLRLCSASVTMSSDPSSALLLLRVPSPHALPRSAFTPSSVLSDRAHLPPGFVPLRDFTCTQPLARKAPSLALWSVLRLSQPLDGLIRTHARGLVSSRCHVQGYARSRTSLSTQPPCLVDRSLPPCRSSVQSSRACAQVHLHERRLRGLHPREEAFARTQLFTESEAASFFEFRSSRSPSSPQPPAYPAASAPDVAASNLRFRARPRRPSSAFAQRGFR